MKRICAMLLCLTVLLSAWGCSVIKPPAAEPSDNIFQEEWPLGSTKKPKPLDGSIQKIDVSAADSQTYRDWLAAYYDAQDYTMASFMPEPDAHKKTKQKEQKTWDWGDELELVLYEFSNGTMEEHSLYTRSKATGEERIIREIVNDDDCGDGWVSFHMLHLAPSFVVYAVGGAFVSYAVYLYSPQTEKSQHIGRLDETGIGNDSSSFLDAQRTKWWACESNGDSIYRLYYIDLEKLAADQDDALRVLVSDWLVHCAWMTELGGHSKVVFRAATHHEGGWWDPYYLGVYDLESDALQGFLELPKMEGWSVMQPMDEGRYYYFDGNVAGLHFGAGEEQDLHALDFYVITL